LRGSRGASPIPEKRVGHSLKDLGPSQKTLRRPWCPKVVMDLEVLPHIPFAMKNWPQEYKKMHIKLSWVRTFSSPSSKQPFHMKMPLVRFLFPTARLQSDVEGCFSLFLQHLVTTDSAVTVTRQHETGCNTRTATFQSASRTTNPSERLSHQSQKALGDVNCFVRGQVAHSI